jgi:hypothetical protein
LANAPWRRRLRGEKFRIEGVILFKQDDTVLDWTYWWHPHLNDKS